MKKLLEYIFRICGIDANTDASEDEAIALIKRALTPIMEKMTDEAVDEAIAADTLRPDEREWALDFAGENFAAFRAFLNLRKPIPLAVMALAGRLAKPVVSDALQESINKKIGVKPELFAKYNSSGTKDSAGIDATTMAIMKQVGVSRDTFLKYNKPVRSNTFV